ncbi:uncharacterized protein F5147DRAFT_653785 [Suillus discolor]|uniref:Uncharacterized protein n=1 Tax=Suillus discolor TaxID=1912936 RepID=A0A9P7F515_9AGAM|nr:uncharacterized protein F5147DRAFT_653785 [Suillus discolor]KAG2106535.1 hypothetical protein F5147DRAFT_653785 [Suillus discolor]
MLERSNGKSAIGEQYEGWELSQGSGQWIIGGGGQADVVVLWQPHNTVNFTGYLSDESKDHFDSETDGEHEEDGYGVAGSSRGVSSCLPTVPPLKRRKLKIPFCMEHKIKKERHADESGPDGLQAKQTCTIQSHLTPIVKRGHSSIKASECAAESHGFTAVWGGHQLHSWTHNWVSKRYARGIGMYLRLSEAQEHAAEGVESAVSCMSDKEVMVGHAFKKDDSAHPKAWFVSFCMTNP